MERDPRRECPFESEREARGYLVWGVQIKAEKPTQTLSRLIWSRVVSFAMMLVMAFLLLVSLAISAALAALATWSAEFMPGREVLMQIANGTISFAVLTFLFCAAFKILPDVRIAWRVVWFGGAVTACSSRPTKS